MNDTTFKGFFLRKYPRYAYIYKVIENAAGNALQWSDLTDPNIDLIADNIRNNVAPNTARTYLALFKSLLNKAKMSGIEFPAKRFPELLKCRPNKVVRAYLSIEELKKIQNYTPQNSNEAYVRALFLIGAYTGARQSDFKRLDRANITDDGFLSYVSEKTQVRAFIPLKPIVKELLNDIPKTRLPLPTFNNIIRRICRNAGIITRVKVLKGGREYEGEKWRFVSSHTARISFCSNLFAAGCDVVSLAKMAGHSDINMTKRYIACNTLNLPKKALKYFS